MIHDWNKSIKKLFLAEPKRYSLQEFEDLKMVNNLSQLTVKKLDRWLISHPDAYIISDVKENNAEALLKIKKEYPLMSNKIIPQIYYFDEYEKVKKMGFDNIILTLYKANYPDEDVLEFISNHSVIAVSIPFERALTDLPQKIKNKKISVFAHTVNEKALMDALRQNGVDGFAADFLL